MSKLINMYKFNKWIYNIFLTLLIVTLLTFTAISSTFAKYTSVVSGNAVVNVARFSNKLNGISTTTLENEIDIFGSGFNVFTNKVSYTDTSGAKDFKIILDDASDVDVGVIIKMQEINPTSILPLSFVYGSLGSGYDNQYSNIMGNITNLGGDLAALDNSINQRLSSNSFPLGSKNSITLDLKWYINYNIKFNECLGYIYQLITPMQIINNNDLDFEHAYPYYLSLLTSLETIINAADAAAILNLSASGLSNIKAFTAEISTVLTAANNTANGKLTSFNDNIRLIDSAKYLTQKLKISCTFNQVM